MKKQFLYLMAAAASLTACSTNDVIGDAANGGNGDGIVTADDQQVINIGAAINAQPVQATRATVGGVGEGEDVFHSWNGESLYLFMLQKGTLNPATEGTDKNIIWNTKYIAPKPQEGDDPAPKGSLTRDDKTIKYYPLADYNEATQKYGFDFYGYYDGGAAQPDDDQNTLKYYKSVTTGEGGTVTFEETDDAADGKFLAVDYTIDGSHDLLAGKAELGDKPEVTSGTDWDNIQKRAFSAYTSRRDVQPSIDFKHLLSRIQFNVIAGNEITVGYMKGQTLSQDDTNITADKYRRAMKVTGVKIVGLPNSGKLVIASTDEKNYPSSSLIWDTKDTDKDNEFSLKDTKGTAISSENSVALTGQYDSENEYKFVGNKVQIGDALMVKAGETEYKVEVTLEQWVCVNEEKIGDGPSDTDETKDGWEKKTQTITGTISLPKTDGATDLTAFAAGTSYTVNITVYGYEKIDVTGNLIAWGKFETEIKVDLDGDDNDWTVKENE